MVHYTLIKFPDIAFFTSPIPLHIAAMVILFGQMSHCDRLSTETAIEDIWTALDMLPRFRWRWERRDMNGSHPLIERLAEKVLCINLSEVKRTGTPVLIPEDDWEASSPSGTISPTSPGPQLSPTHTHASFNNHTSHGHSNSGNGTGDVNGRTLADVPPGLFWPMDPQHPVTLSAGQIQMPGNVPGNVNYYQAIGTIGCQPSQDSYMSEEKDPTVTKAHVQNWMSQVRSRVLLRMYIEHITDVSLLFCTPD